MTDPDLFAVLDRATDDIRPDANPHQAAASALARARVVRIRRRGVVAGALAAVAVVAVVVATGAGGDDRSQEPVNPVPTTPAVVHEPWDPRGAADLPQRDSVLPRTIELPSDPIELPLSGPARLAFEDGAGRIHLLESDGRWGWTKPPSGEMYATALSDDGTMLASLGDEGLFVTGVRYGSYEWRQLELPPGRPELWTTLDAKLQWRGDDELVLTTFARGVGVIHVDGDPPSVPDLDLLQYTGYTETPEGGAVAFAVGGDGRRICEVVDDALSRCVADTSMGGIWKPLANDTRVVGSVEGVPAAAGATQHAGLVVLDREGYEATNYLPIAGTRYRPGLGTGGAAGGVAPLAWLDDHTVLLEYAPATFGRSWTLVAWDVTTGELSLVSKGPDTLGLVGVARDLVAD